MTASIKSPELPLSLDKVFTPPSRSQWAKSAVAGAGPKNAPENSSTQSPEDVLQQLRRTTLEGIPIEVLYDSADTTLNLAREAQARSSLDNRLRVDFDKASQASKAILEGLQGGITSIELRNVKPADISATLRGVQLDLVTISLRLTEQYDASLQAMLHIADEQGLDSNRMQCNFNADPLSIALATATTESDLSAHLVKMANFAKTTATTLPTSKCILVDVALHHNAGASTVEELHAALATATLYLEALLNTGMSVADASAQIVFQVAMDADVLLGVAKLRALRALWQTVIAQFDGDCRVSASIVAETSHRYLSRLQPWNNHLRNLCAGTAAILGGADTLMVHPHDVLQRDTQNADKLLGDRMARNTLIILERECALGKVQDPMAGSYAIENLTQQLMQHAWQSLGSTDTGEGWVNELLSGRWQTRLTSTHKQRITLMQQDQRIAVGVNRFVQTDESVNSAPAPNNPDNTATQALVSVRDSETFEPGADQEALS